MKLIASRSESFTKIAEFVEMHRGSKALYFEGLQQDYRCRCWSTEGFNTKMGEAKGETNPELFAQFNSGAMSLNDYLEAMKYAGFVLALGCYLPSPVCICIKCIEKNLPQKRQDFVIRLYIYARLLRFNLVCHSICLFDLDNSDNSVVPKNL